MNHKRMKLWPLAAAILGLTAIQAFGQTNQSGGTTTGFTPLPPVSPMEILANIPQVPLANETVGVSQGTLMRGDSTFASATLVDYTFKTNFFARAEIDAGPSSAGIEGIGLGGGLCKSWNYARMWGVMEGRRDFTPGKWDGIAGIGVAYTPSTNGVFANFSIMGEQRIVIEAGVKQHVEPNTETVAGIRYSF